MIHRVRLPFPGFDELRADARAEGYRFIDRLAGEWESGKNRFDAQGEMLCGYSESGLLLAVGGLNRDPFADRVDTGRIRRVYVRPAWRGRGIGAALVTALTAEARRSFGRVRLRAENLDAARLYERLGFAPLEEPNATHVLVLDADGDC